MNLSEPQINKSRIKSYWFTVLTRPTDKLSYGIVITDKSSPSTGGRLKIVYDTDSFKL